jgi:hypothetical protein
LGTHLQLPDRPGRSGDPGAWGLNFSPFANLLFTLLLSSGMQGLVSPLSPEDEHTPTNG